MANWKATSIGLYDADRDAIERIKIDLAARRGAGSQRIHDADAIRDAIHFRVAAIRATAKKGSTDGPTTT